MHLNTTHHRFNLLVRVDDPRDVKRAADKTRGAVPQTPLSLVHLRNLTMSTETGAVVLPAAPGFYQQPKGINDLVDFVVQRILDQFNLDIPLSPRWDG